MARERVILAYSGGLDTSVMVPWIGEKYNLDVVTFTCDLGQTKQSTNRLRASIATASTAPVLSAFCRIFSISSPWPRSQVNVTTSRLYFSPIQGTMTLVSRPPL